MNEWDTYFSHFKIYLMGSIGGMLGAPNGAGHHCRELLEPTKFRGPLRLLLPILKIFGYIIQNYCRIFNFVLWILIIKHELRLTIGYPQVMAVPSAEAAF